MKLSRRLVSVGALAVVLNAVALPCSVQAGVPFSVSGLGGDLKVPAGQSMKITPTVSYNLGTFLFQGPFGLGASFQCCGTAGTCTFTPSSGGQYTGSPLTGSATATSSTSGTVTPIQGQQISLMAPAQSGQEKDYTVIALVTCSISQNGLAGPGTEGKSISLTYRVTAQ